MDEGSLGRRFIEGTVLALVASIIAVLLFLLFRFKGIDARRDKSNKPAAEAGGKVDPGYRTCPLCFSALTKGETVRTVVFGPSPKSNPAAPTERIAHICGCPHCYPSNSMVKRMCPVCKGEIPSDGFLYARMFERPGKTHVHVIGCTECRGFQKAK